MAKIALLLLFVFSAFNLCGCVVVHKDDRDRRIIEKRVIIEDDDHQGHRHDRHHD